jgi:hypothetical protein
MRWTQPDAHERLESKFKSTLAHPDIVACRRQHIASVCRESCRET